MKHPALALLLCAAMLPAGALAQQTTYVFPYEGFRYTQNEGETVLTQTNLSEHADLIASLGTTQEAVLAGYMASGTVMEIIPEDGGQIAVSVVSAGAFSEIQSMDEMSDEQLEQLREQFEESGLYDACELTRTSPVCVRLTSSAMVASMPVYTLRYATLHLGQMLMLTQTVVGRECDETDDARMVQVLGGVKLLQSRTEPTPTPTPVPTPTPEPTPVPTPGVAEEEAVKGEMTVEGVPAYTNSRVLTLSGTAQPSRELRVTVDGESVARTTTKKDGTFSVNVSLPREGELTLAVMTDEAERRFTLRYEKPAAALEILEPTELTFTGDNVLIKGVTEPEATVYVTGKGNRTNVKAGRTGVFSVRIFMSDAGTESFTLRASLKEYADTEITLTLTRELTEREQLAAFRQKVIEADYAALVKNPAQYAGKNFIFRGKIAEFTDYDGTPCALVLTDNVSTGVWNDPVWVLLQSDMEFKEGDIITFYLIGLEQTIPADGQYTKDGAEVEAPVARAVYATENK